MPVRTVLHRGPKAKKAVAFALDWPGWSRGATTPELALATFESYRDRYRPIAAAVMLAKEFDTSGRIKVIEDHVGTGAIDFWGISFAPSSSERDPMDEAEFERKIALLRACWAYFDDVCRARIARDAQRPARRRPGP